MKSCSYKKCWDLYCIHDSKKGFFIFNNWIIEKYKPGRIVYSNLYNLLLKFMVIYGRAWWDHLIVRLDEIKMTVFCKGILYGLVQTDFMTLNLFNSKDNKTRIWTEKRIYDHLWSFRECVTKWTRRFRSKYFLMNPWISKHLLFMNDSCFLQIILRRKA